MDQPISLLEPLMPPEGDADLENLVFDLIHKAASLSGRLHPVVTTSIGDLVRSMNCYYSNLIEGHNPHPQDIERALATDFSADPHKHNRQLEAKAHIEVQSLIDSQHIPHPLTSPDFIPLATPRILRLREAWIQGQIDRRQASTITG